MAQALLLRRSVNKSKRSTSFTGVYRSTGKKEAYAASVYDKEKAWTVYLGTFGSELEAARAHDVATFKCSGTRAICNFPKTDYEKIWALMQNVTKEQLMTIIRRNGSRFCRTSDSNYRGVFRKHKERKWAAHKQIEKETFYLGCFETAEEAAMAYDIEGIKLKGWNALTNFDISLYNVEAILALQKHLGFPEGKVSFVKRELLENPKKYTKGKGIRFLDEIEDHLKTLASVQQAGGDAGAGAGADAAQIVKNEDPTDDDVSEEQIRAKKTLNLFDDTPPYHFHAEAGTRFKPSSSSCFHSYKKF